MIDLLGCLLIGSVITCCLLIVLCLAHLVDDYRYRRAWREQERREKRIQWQSKRFREVGQEQMKEVWQWN